MEVPTIKSRWIAFAAVAALWAVALVPSTAAARDVAGLGSAIAAGTKAGGAKAACAGEAQRKARRFAGRAGTSSVATKKVRRTKAAFQRRCMARQHRSAKRKSAKPSGTPSAGPLAIGIDGGYSGWWSEEIEFRTALNAAVTRHAWDPTAEAVDAQDDLILEAAEVHTRIHAVLGANELGDANHYREWVVSFIRRYGQGGSFWSEHPSLDAGHYAITTFELGNEPYFGGMSPTEYANTVRPTLDEVKQLDLPAKLIIPSYIFGSDTHWIDTLYQQIPDLNSLFYAFADHPYWYGHAPSDTGNGNSPFGRIETLREKMAEHGAGDKPLFLTEYGESTANCGEECVSEAVQAQHIQEMIAAAVGHPDWGVELLTFFQLHDWGTNTSSREEQFGLLRQDGTPKPAYAIARAAMQQYRG